MEGETKMDSIYYVILFSDLDNDYAGENDYETYEEAKEAFDELVKEDEEHGIEEYTMIELLKCGGEHEPESLETHELAGAEALDEENPFEEI